MVCADVLGPLGSICGHLPCPFSRACHPVNSVSTLRRHSFTPAQKYFLAPSALQPLPRLCAIPLFIHLLEYTQGKVTLLVF